MGGRTNSDREKTLPFMTIDAFVSYIFHRVFFFLPFIKKQKGKTLENGSI